MSPLGSRAAVEREIAVLTSTLERARVELGRLRAHGPQPRGVFVGAVTGMLVVVAAYLAFVCWAMLTLAGFSRTG